MTLIVLNNDVVICGDCYEAEEPFEIDPGRVPFASVEIGTCSNCGKTEPEVKT